MNIKKVHRFIRTKSFQIAAHVLAWLAFVTIFHIIHPSQSQYPIRIGIVYNFFFIILFFYLNVLVFIPGLLSKKRFILYIAVVISSIAGVFFITRAFTYFHDLYHLNSSIIHEPANANNNRLPMRSAVLVFITFAISTSVRVTQQLFRNEEKRKEIEQEKTKSELAYLKSQINPHFLFNTLNSIYSMANKESEKTAKAIVKLSGLMRYVLYESDNELVPLSEEISHIQDYIELQKLRIFNNVKVSFQLEGDFKNRFIEPLLLIPIVENAFKHGVDSTTNSQINILIRTEGNEFTLQAENSLIETGNNEKSGIGLKNLKKRLEMLYANNHILLIDKKDVTFRVKLSMKLKSGY
jgi:sensor histidine kinase YesM